MNEMIKRRKDEGFTLIELMIVIAVIGILAVVLVPRVGGIKTAAKSAGIDTNVRAVQAYVQSRVTYWSTATYSVSGFSSEITDTLVVNAGTGEKVTNPIAPADTAIIAGSTAIPTDGTQVEGAVYVVFPATQDLLITNGVEISGIDSNGDIYNNVNIKP